MKKIAITILILCGLTVASYSQEQGLSDKMGVGFHLTQHQNDFGLGVNLTSPYFIKKNLAVRVKGNLMYNEHLDTNSEMTWTSYSNVSIGVVSKAGQVGEHIRLYGEGGVLLLFPSSTFSSQSTNLGGYGLFGFEFFTCNYFNYYIEIGGVGTGAIADNVAEKPIYSNGLLINVGFRFHF